MRTTLSVAVALLVAYGILLGLSKTGTETATQAYWRKNRNVIAAYAMTEHRPVVFVGSSLTAAVRFAGFESCVYNLGLIGESALTGMDVINGGARLPDKVYVEVNFPERESNTDLIHSAEGWLAVRFPDFVYVTPISYLAQLGGILLQRLRAIPPANTSGLAAAGGSAASEARATELAIQRSVFETKLAEPVLKNKLVEFSIKIRELQKNGVKVVLLELPIHPELEETPRARQIREAFQQAFPKLHTVSAAMLAQGVTIKTADGLHLTEDDSSRILRNFLPELNAVCGMNVPLNGGVLR